jgi:N-acetylneuraminate lyase
MVEIGGIMPALVTPVNDAGRFQPKVFERLLERVYGAGVHGVYVCGQTGEGLQLSLGDRRAATECAVRQSPNGTKVIVHVGAPTTADAVALAEHAARSGAHMISSLPPSGNYSFEEIRQYYEALAKASELPLLIYYFPSMAPSIRTTEQILELCAIPNVIGLKFTDSDFYRMWAVRMTGAVVFAGSDEMLVAGLIMGANGGIGSTYNLIPESYVAMYRMVADKKWEEARLIQEKINRLIQVILRYPVHPAIKQLLQWSGIDCGKCILPRRELTGEEQRTLRIEIMKTELGHTLLAGNPGI